MLAYWKNQSTYVICWQVGLFGIEQNTHIRTFSTSLYSQTHFSSRNYSFFTRYLLFSFLTSPRFLFSKYILVFLYFGIFVLLHLPSFHLLYALHSLISIVYIPVSSMMYTYIVEKKFCLKSNLWGLSYKTYWKIEGYEH